MEEEEEHTARKQQLAMLCQRLNKITRDLNEDEHINQIIGSKCPETCLTYLMDLEKKGDPHLDHIHLTKLMDSYTRVFSNMPLEKQCKNESYARMMVRFAELRGIQDPNKAEGDFNAARSLYVDFAFVHIAHAQFELSQGNTKKSTSILQRAIELNAKPKELLEAAMQKLQSGKVRLLSPEEDKENIQVFRKGSQDSDGTGDLPLSSVFRSGTDPRNAPAEDHVPARRTWPQRVRAVGMMPGRVPLVPISISEMEDDDDGRSMQHTYSSMSRQTSGALFSLYSAKKTFGDGDVFNLKPPVISPEPRPWENSMATVDSTTTLLHSQDKRDPIRREDITDTLNKIISWNSAEKCRAYLMDLEKRGDPHTSPNLLISLKNCYTKVFTGLPLGQHGKHESYARMLVRFAELMGIEDPEEGRDQFITARSYSRAFAFVHIAFAQFEVSQGNVKKASSILQKAFGLGARPTEHLEAAMRNLKAGRRQLLPTEDRETLPEPQSHGPVSCSSHRGEREQEPPFRLSVTLSQAQPKPPSREPNLSLKLPGRINRLATTSTPPEERFTPPDPRPTPRLLDSLPTPSLPFPSRFNPPIQTPNYKDPCANSFITPVEKRNPILAAPPSAGHKPVPAQQPCTPRSQASHVQQTHQSSMTALSNDSITINGKQFFVLKMIGRGGSSKVYQVLDHRKQLFAVKHVNLEEADTQTVESYKNEIEHLNRLQLCSDQIIKLFDYEITHSSIFMLMECGSLDLNTWLRNRKSVNPLERKFYWKNMLEAVHTIHKHGIVHSDLKPANFVIVNASLKLIDFGIANHIQPDVTSVMKDSQVGTLNYMPPEAIKNTAGKASSKISPKGDVWSLGCILYCMTYGKTPFQTITNQIAKLHAITDTSHAIEFPDITEKDLMDVLKRCLVRDPKDRISIAELLEHSYLQMQHQPTPEPENNDLRRILNELVALQSPNSIVRAANNLAKMANSGRKLDAVDCVKSSSKPSWKM